MVKNEPDPIARIRQEHQRLAILCVLDGAHGPHANDEILAPYLAYLGIGCARRHLRDLLSGLAEDGLIRVDPRGNLLVVELTRRGSEVATGTARHEGIAFPMADCPYR